MLKIYLSECDLRRVQISYSRISSPISKLQSLLGLSAHYLAFSLDSRVLKPPGGGSSDIFGAAPEETSPRRIKAHNQSQLGSALFGDVNGTDNASVAMSPRSNKPGNDSYKRLFGPPDAPSTTPNARNHMRSNIPLSGGSSISSLSSPAKSTASSNSTSGIANGYASNGSNSSNDMTGKGPRRTRKR